MPEIVLHFGGSRTTTGEDIAAVIRENLPEGDVRAELDAAGAVVGYALTLHFEDGDTAVDAAFVLTEYLRSTDTPYEVGETDG